MKTILLLLCSFLSLLTPGCSNVPPETKAMLRQIGREVVGNAALSAASTSLQLTRQQLRDAQASAVVLSPKAPVTPESSGALILSQVEQSILRDLARLLQQAEDKLSKVNPANSLSPVTVETTLVSPEP